MSYSPYFALEGRAKEKMTLICVCQPWHPSMELLPVILGSIKCYDSRQGKSVFSMVKCSKMACVGDNLITQTMHKTTRSTSSHTWSNCPGSLLVFCTLCNKNWGGACRLAKTYITFISLKYSYNHTSIMDYYMQLVRYTGWIYKYLAGYINTWLDI